VDNCPALPPGLRTCLEKSWSEVGKRVTQYRDCLQHYVPVAFGISSVHMQRLSSSIWSVSAWLPDNPEARSQSEFQYSARLDACTYGWQLVSEIITVVTTLVEAVERNSAADAPGANDLRG